MTVPFAFFTGRSLIWFKSVGLALSATFQSNLPILASPAGRMRFCAEMALTTSSAETLWACMACWSRSTCAWGILPPYGGKAAENGDQEGENHKSIWSPQGDLNDPHVRFLPPRAPRPRGESNRRSAAAGNLHEVRRR